MRNLTRVLVADDHAVTRRGIRELLRDGFGDVEIEEVATADEVLARVEAHRWDLVLLDILMPGPGIFDVLAGIRESDEHVPILILTAVIETDYVVQCMRGGANGVIHKSRAADELISAVRRVADGGTYMHPETAMEVALDMRRKSHLPHEDLSDREMQVFRLLALGRTVKEVGGELGISDKTVATYVIRIREKTGLRSHVEIARYALQHGLVD